MYSLVVLAVVCLVGAQGKSKHSVNHFEHALKTETAEDMDPNMFEFDRVYRLENLGVVETFGVPVGLSDSLYPSEDYTLEALVFVNEDTNWARVLIQGTGIPFVAPVTAWAIRQFSEANTLTEIGLPSPLGSTTAAYNNGRDSLNEPNAMAVDENGNGVLDVILDWNPMIGGQVPMVNFNSFSNQADFADDYDNGLYTDLFQDTYGDTGLLQPVTRCYVREFNEDGSQLVDESTLRAVLPRHQLRVRRFAVIVHIDYLSHGGAASIFAFNNANPAMQDHYAIGWFGISGAQDVTHEYQDSDSSSDSSP